MFKTTVREIVGTLLVYRLVLLFVPSDWNDILTIACLQENKIQPELGLSVAAFYLGDIDSRSSTKEFYSHFNYAVFCHIRIHCVCFLSVHK